jgi:hypothetical protein
MGHVQLRWYGMRLACSVMLVAFLATPILVGPIVVAASSVTLTVTTTADTSNACATTGVAPCSLRDVARYASVRMTSVPVIVALPAGDYQQTGWDSCENLPVTAGAFSISSSVNSASLHPVFVIGSGAGATIVHGAGASTHYPVFDFGHADVTLAGMTITNGNADNCSPASGGGIRAGGGKLTLANVIVTGNFAKGGGGLTIDGDAHILNSQITNNQSCTGAGIAIGGGSASVIANTTITGNQQETVNQQAACYGSAGGNGAGLVAGNGVLQVTGSVIANNVSFYSQASSSPGGIGVHGATLAITNSTIAGNTSGDDTGGITGTGTITLTNDTIADNISGGGLPEDINRVAPGTFTLADSIVRGSGTLCSGVTSAGYNIASDSSCSLTLGTDHPTTDPQLGTFGDHGGPTATYDLSVGSPAINAIPAGSCSPSVDQRGVSRPQGAGCDIGAFESGGAPPTLSAVSPPSGGIAGGGTVTLSGSGFVSGTTVTVDATAAATTFVNGTTLRVVMPPHSVGLADMTVAVPAVGTATLPRVYLYGDVLPLPAPAASGPAAGGNPAPLPAPRTPGTGEGGPPAPLPTTPRPSGTVGKAAGSGGATTAPAPLPARR